VSRYQESIHPLTPILIINPLFAVSIYCDPRHPPCSIYVPDSFLYNLQALIGLPLGLAPFTSYSINFFTLSFLQHTANCFAVAPRLYHLILVSLSQLFTWNSIFYINTTHPSDHSHLCLVNCHLIFFSYRPGVIPCNILLCTSPRSHLAISYRLTWRVID